MRDDPKARRAIEGLLPHLSPPAERVDRWPDKEDRTQPEIDAIAGRYAIEHTCIESFPGQSEDNSFFERLTALEDRVRLPFHLSVTFPVGALARGTDWPTIVATVEHWIVTESGDLPLGQHSISLDSVPFAMSVWRHDDTWAPRLFIARHAPGPDGFVEMVQEHATRKIAKLGRYQADGKTAVLLLETRCVALMSAGRMRDGLDAAFPDGLPAGADQVWFADWSCEAVPSYCRLR